MSKESIQKKIQRKAERRAKRKLPVADAESETETSSGSGYQGELDDQGNPVGTVYNKDGSIAQPTE